MNINDKRFLRQKTLNKLNELTYNEKEMIEKSLYAQCFHSSCWKNATTIGVTYSTEVEWNTVPIIEQAWRENKKVCLPKTDQVNKRLNYYLIHSFTDVERGYANILEPKVTPENYIEKNAIDLLIVPGIVFNTYGYRIGFGGGYYDRFLIDFNQLTVSILSKIQLIDTKFHEKHDIPVQYLITEDEVLQTKEEGV